MAPCSREPRSVYSDRRIVLPQTIGDERLVAKNHSARLWDMGDGVACLEFKSKMNSVDGDIVAMEHRRRKG